MLIPGTKQARFRYIFEQYNLFLFNICRKLMDADKATDICAETFISFWYNMDRLTGEAEIQDFLLSSLRVKCLDLASTDSGVNKHLYHFSKADFEDAGIEAHVLKDLFKSIDELPDECRSIFKLYYLESKMQGEIATTLNIGIDVIKSQLSKAKRTLRFRLDYWANEGAF